MTTPTVTTTQNSVDAAAAPAQPGAAVACLLYVLPGCDLVDANPRIVIEDDGDY